MEAALKESARADLLQGGAMMHVARCVRAAPRHNPRTLVGAAGTSLPRGKRGRGGESKEVEGI